MCFFKKRKARKLAEQKENEALARKKAEILNVQPSVEVKKNVAVQPNPVVEKKVEQAKPKVVKTTVAVEKKTAQAKPVTAKKAVVSKEKVEQTKPADESKDDKPVKYHVSQNKDPRSDKHKSWRVRKQGSQKTIKYFSTQKEAIEYAESLAGSAGSSVVIHKLDGSIRKQDYTKK